MQRVLIRCEDQNHDSRKSVPGWSDVLGHVDYPDGRDVPKDGPKGYLCEACGNERAKNPPKRTVDPRIAAIARAVKAASSGTAPSAADQKILDSLSS
jgi:hypothetical protein